MVKDEVLRAQLVLAVENAAKWRATRAEQHPTDQRNITSSQSLAALAKRIESLPVNNPHLAAYIDVMERAVAIAVAKRSVLHALSNVESQFIGRYGFDYPRDGNDNPAPFLFVLTREITDLVEEEEERIQEKRDEPDNEAPIEAAAEAATETAHAAEKKAAKKTPSRRRPSQGALAH
jgi:hypothetical protein